MRMSHFAAAVMLAGCSRYEYRPTACPQPVSHSAIGWQDTQNHPGIIEGVVLSIDSQAPLPAAAIWLKPDVRRWGTDSGGQFRVDSLAPGAYTLRIARLGYSVAESKIVVRVNSGVQVVAAMERSQIVLDGCGYAMLPVRKPWWKLW